MRTRPARGPIAVLWDRHSLGHWHEAQFVARARGWKLLSLEIRDAGKIGAAIATALEARASELVALATSAAPSARPSSA